MEKLRADTQQVKAEATAPLGEEHEQEEQEDHSGIDQLISSLHEHNIDDETIHDILAACELDDGSIDEVHFEQLVTQVIQEEKAAAEGSSAGDADRSAPAVDSEWKKNAAVQELEEDDSEAESDWSDTDGQGKQSMVVEAIDELEHGGQEEQGGEEDEEDELAAMMEMMERHQLPHERIMEIVAACEDDEGAIDLDHFRALYHETLEPLIAQEQEGTSGEAGEAGAEEEAGDAVNNSGASEEGEDNANEEDELAAMMAMMEQHHMPHGETRRLNE